MVDPAAQTAYLRHAYVASGTCPAFEQLTGEPTLGSVSPQLVMSSSVTMQVKLPQSPTTRPFVSGTNSTDGTMPRLSSKPSHNQCPMQAACNNSICQHTGKADDGFIHLINMPSSESARQLHEQQDQTGAEPGAQKQHKHKRVVNETSLKLQLGKTSA